MTTIRSILPDDLPQWRPLWDGYNAFYGRQGTTALDETVTLQTWRRFFEPESGVRAWVAESADGLSGIAHAVRHPSTTRRADVWYLQDLFVAPAHRARGIGRALIEAVAEQARSAGAARLYWQTHATNVAGRALYDTLARHDGFIVYAMELHKG